MPKTTKIEPVVPLVKPRLKVAAYARVSKETDCLMHSLSAQVSYYSKLIQKNPEWEYTGVYADSFISGTSMENRPELQRLLASFAEQESRSISDNCKWGIQKRFQKGLIGTANKHIFGYQYDEQLQRYVIIPEEAESVRYMFRLFLEGFSYQQIADKLNTAGIRTINNCLFSEGNVRKLITNEVYAVDILWQKTLSSISQEESRSISENVTLGHRRRMADGKVSVPFGRFLGYDRGEHGELIVNEKEAEVVREIYRLFLSGLTPHGIGKELTARHIPTPGGRVKWTASTVKSILTNEKYKGDALLQKTFTPDYLTKKTKKNDGQIPQYYVENSHPAIITPEIYEAVQTEMKRRQGTKSRYSGVDILASKLICGECGSSYRPKVWHSTDQYRRTIYQCGHKYKDGCKCSTPNLTAEAIHAVFIRSFNEIITNKNEIIRNLRESIALASDMTELESKRDAANNEVLFLTDIVEKLIAENARIPQDQKEYNKKYKTAIERYEAAKASYDSIIAQIAEEHKRVQRMQAFIRNVRELGVITEFDEMLWGLLEDKVVVYSKDDIRVKFKK